MAGVAFEMNSASEVQIVDHLALCDADFVPPLARRVDLAAYAQKIVDRATRFEAWDGTLVGLLAAYCNDPESSAAFITNLSVRREWRGKGIATHLIELLVAHAGRAGFRCVRLEVDLANERAVDRYEKSGFAITGMQGGVAIMRYDIEGP